jgi:hypothetical protein
VKPRVMMIVCGAAALCASEAQAQALFCLSPNCATTPITYYPHALDAPTGGVLATTAWMRGFVQAATPFAAGGSFTAATPAMPPPVFGMLPPPPYNMLVEPTDELSPLVVGQVLSTPVAVVTNHGESRVRAVSGYAGAAQATFSGFWSDPAIACTNTKCVAVVSDTNAGFARFVFNGASVTPDSFSIGSLSGMRVMGPTNRPAIVAVDSERFIMVARTVSATGTLELTLREFDTRTSPPSTRADVVIPLTAPLTPGTPIVASSGGGSMLVAFSTSTGPSMIQSINVSAVAVNPSLGTPSTPRPVVRRLAAMRTFDLARNATTYVLSWQQPGLFRMAVQSVAVGPAEYDVAYRDAVAADQLAGTSVVRAHRMASGPKPLLVYEETLAMGGGTAPRALGYVLDVCRGPSDCELTLGAGWIGNCDTGLCRPVPRMDAGGPDAMTADATVDATVDARDAASPRDSSASMDGATMQDVIAPADRAELDAADASAMDSESVVDGAGAIDAAITMDAASTEDVTGEGDAAAGAGGIPAITGGACACRAAGHGRSSLGVCAALLALCVLRVRKRRADDA